MQDLWTTELGWDDPLPENLETRWRDVLEKMQSATGIAIPRWLGLTSTMLAVELHAFSDASHAAPGAVIYLRVMNDFNDIRISLVSAKTKVAPRKRDPAAAQPSRSVRITTPRLELAAAVLLVRHLSHIRKVLNLHNIPVHLWTDSTTTMYWIKGNPSHWKDFVRNRVALIQKTIPDAHWHHVAGEENPADYASRGLTPQQLAGARLWWEGPAWLKQHSRFWPSTMPALNDSDDLEERKRVVATVTLDPTAQLWDLIQRFSTLTRLLRITALCVRAVTRFKLGAQPATVAGPLTPAELEAAKLYWVKATQRAYFAKEIQQLNAANHNGLPSSNALCKLTPKIDASGLLRVGGRLQNSLLDPDAKNPLILPRESELTTLIIRHTHQATLHGGTQVTLATIRQTYSIIGGRTPIRSFILRCVKCSRQRAITAQQLMGQLPSSRTQPSRPFSHSGIDYAGPMTLKTWRGRGAKTYKGYIALFVCLATSAIHLEIVTDYSAEAFIAAFKRFTGRRGICLTLTSDCGTNLVGADAELRRLFSASSAELGRLATLLANDNTEWRFNPPSAPHFGGKWEAGVKSVKFHLKRVIGDATLTYEEYSTLLIQIEAVLNSRPLCPLSDDPTDVDALTPGHFLIGAALNTVPEPSLTHLPESRLSRWQRQRQIVEQFWTRWSTEYLQRLQAATKWRHQSHNLKVGTLVLIADERYPPSKWPLARITAVHPGTDGLVRVVTVRTQSSTYKRPITKLCPLPISNETE